MLDLKNSKSKFDTTQRNKMAFWTTNIVFIPAFLSAFVFLTDQIFHYSRQSQYISSSLQQDYKLELISTAFFLLVLVSCMIDRSYQVFVEDRTRLSYFSFGSLLVINSIALIENYDLGATVALVEDYTSVINLSLLFVICTLLSRRYMCLFSAENNANTDYFWFSKYASKKRFTHPFVIAVSMMFILATALTIWATNTLQWADIVKAVISLTLAFAATRQYKKHFSGRNDEKSGFDHSISSLVIATCLLVIAISLLRIYLDIEYFLFFSNDLSFLSLSFSLALVLLTLEYRGAGLDRLQSFVYYVTRSIRQDRISSLINPALEHTNPLNWLLNWGIRQIWPFTLNRLLKWATFLLPATLIYMVWREKISGFSQIAALVTLLFIGWAVAWFFINRQKFIVVPFQVINTAKEDKIEQKVTTTANLLTSAITEELREIAVLLNMRQAENINSNSNQLHTLFITSGQQKELTDQLTAIADFSLPGKIGVNARNLLAFWIQTLARIIVRGEVQLLANGNIEAIVELRHRNGHTTVVDHLEIPAQVSGDISSTTIRKAAKIAATKLVMELGQNQLQVSNWHTLRLFLEGISASHRNNWWLAISRYRQALEVEKSHSGEFGQGHYHLGAALVSLGHTHAGMLHLHLADQLGPPMPEVKYMLALTNLYTNWHVLHKDTAIFELIQSYCRDAIALKRNFAEANHLRGAAYYRRGKLLEKKASLDKFRKQTGSTNLEDRNRSIQVSRANSALDYKAARRSYRKTIRQYKRALMQNVFDVLTNPNKKKTHQRISSNMVIANHQLADTYRSLRIHNFSDALYDDVAAAYPGNIENLTDRAMNLCLSNSWQHADEYMRHTILAKPQGSWNSHSNFYISWAMFGGVEESLSQNNNKQAWHSELLSEGFARLDYSIKKRPNFLRIWDQRDWVSQIARLLECFEPLPKKNIMSLANAEQIEWSHLTIWFKLWLGWRVYDYWPHEDQNYTRNLFKSQNKPTLHPKLEGFRTLAVRDCKKLLPKAYWDAWNQLHKVQVSAAKLLKANIELRAEYDLGIAARRLRLAHEECKDQLDELQGVLQKRFEKMCDSRQISLADRKGIDIYLEFAVLTIRLFVGGNEYGEARDIAKTASSMAKKWVQYWVAFDYERPKNGSQRKQDDKYQFTFSPNVMRYQRATLLAWQAIIDVRLSENVRSNEWKTLNLSEEEKLGSNKNISNATNALNRQSYTLDQARKNINAAFAIHPYHPLAYAALAELYRVKGLFERASTEYLALLNIIAPFNLHTYIANWQIDQKSRKPLEGFAGNADESTQAERYRFEDIREYFSYLERVRGMRQFDRFIGQHKIHNKLANIFRETGKHELAIEHYQKAIVWSPYRDTNLNTYYHLAEQLLATERFSDAYDAIQHAKNFFGGGILTSPQEGLHSAFIRHYEILVLECVLLSRLERYSEALDNGIRLYRLVFMKKDAQYRPIDLTDGVRNPLEIAQKFLAELNNLNSSEESQHSREHELKEQYEEWFSEVLNTVLGRLRKTLKGKVTIVDLFLALIEEFSKNNKKLAYHSLLRKRTLLSLRDFIVFKCELVNNIAYNIAQLNLIQSASNDSNFDRPDLVADLPNAQEFSNAAINLMQELLSAMPKRHDKYKDYRKRMAMYLDTFGWQYFSKPEEWSKAEDNIKRALKYDQSSAIIQYHLARIQLANLEKMWQEYELNIRVGLFGDDAHKISNQVRQTSRSLRTAKELDKNRRLEGDLTNAIRRLDRYRNNWQKLQMMLET